MNVLFAIDQSDWPIQTVIVQIYILIDHTP